MAARVWDSLGSHAHYPTLEGLVAHCACAVDCGSKRLRWRSGHPQLHWHNRLPAKDRCGFAAGAVLGDDDDDDVDCYSD